MGGPHTAKQAPAMRRYVKEFVLLTKECQQMKEYDLYKKKKG